MTQSSDSSSDKALALKALKWREQPNRYLAAKARSLQRRYKACKHKRAVRHLHASIDLDLFPIPPGKLTPLKQLQRQKQGQGLCRICGVTFAVPLTCSPDCRDKYREWYWAKEKLLQMELAEWYQQYLRFARRCAWRFALSRENV